MKFPLTTAEKLKLTLWAQENKETLNGLSYREFNDQAIKAEIISEPAPRSFCAELYKTIGLMNSKEACQRKSYVNSQYSSRKIRYLAAVLREWIADCQNYIPSHRKIYWQQVSSVLQSIQNGDQFPETSDS